MAHPDVTIKNNNFAHPNPLKYLNIVYEFLYLEYRSPLQLLGNQCLGQGHCSSVDDV